MSGRLNGKVALITGGASGIGLAMVRLFVAEGARIVVADIQDDKGRALEQVHDGRVRHIRCDVTQEAEIAAAVALASTSFGGLDILVNNAGICDMMPSITAIEAEQWDWIFQVLLRGPALGMKYAAPLLAARGGGAIVNVASVAGMQAGWGPIAYSTAKAGLLHLTRTVAAELSPQRIRVNAVCPGMIATSIFGASLGMDRPAADQFAARVAEVCAHAQPIPRAGQPEDIACAALYLASEEASFVTGVSFVVDGGLSVGPRHAWDANAPNPLADLARDQAQ
ncbi:SDR family NAD(P)-dependent oxidoreductase [Nitrospirillum bahiense]|uniref:NAD(P)-dependent dehydrogenase (Short-subunit alcohol dehydrogenase family) n=1 Tax=Nitrospirillum amazonense TaxID=28077 RepID=A0A560FVK8_9PROT|nr:SDR family oxidoreductase [Nitrospirillum amazonense]TWB25644.1 NAD(P)-dependent dehydrogenase (short-subunit alcohol dehydrogenase family) [Nitrospirillum amazonense]